jgi:hypothetical protein
LNTFPTTITVNAATPAMAAVQRSVCVFRLLTARSFEVERGAIMHGNELPAIGPIVSEQGLQAKGDD